MSRVSVKSAPALPIINIAPWFESPEHKGRLSTSAAIHAACLEYGFFYLDISSYIDPSEPEELARLAHQFFSQPQEEKDKIALSREDGARGSSHSPRILSFVLSQLALNASRIR